MTAEMHLPVFYVRQKLALTTNRYELYAAAPDGGYGPLMGLAEQKRLAFKEQVTFYADETKSRPVFAFRARAMMDLAAGYDITDEGGQQIGYFKKEFGASLLRTTFRIEGPGYQGLGQERSQAIALVRRFLDIPFLPIHFDYADAAGAPLLSVERQGSIRDTYTVRVPDERVDFRVAAAVAVAMDALMAR